MFLKEDTSVDTSVSKYWKSWDQKLKPGCMVKPCFLFWPAKKQKVAAIFSIESNEIKQKG